MGDNDRMNQLTFGDAEYLGKRKRTRREVFLAEMEQVIPWEALLALIEPVYPKAGRGRRPYPLATMLRVHLMQNWFGLSDPEMEEALYEIVPLRQFARLSMTGAMPDETKGKLIWSIAEKRGRQKALPEGVAQEVWRGLERRKAQGASASESGTPVPGDQATVWLRESSLKRTD